MTAAAPSLPPPFRVAAYDTIGSTNDEAKRLARDGAAEGLVVWAKQQQSGRGRRGRAWVSPPGNLYMSLVLRPRCRAAVAAQLGFVAALGLGEALSELAPGSIDFRYKWPNDLLANGKKLAGILLETEMVAGDQPDFVVMGVGVNLASSPRDVVYPATSLAEEGMTEIAPQTTLAGFVQHFAPWLARWRDEGFAPIRAAWLARAKGLGEAVQVRLERGTLDGRFLDLDDDGALVLGMPEGSRRIAAGEIFPVAA
jgi:BirA family transcriptional regulator, biotin operon repressor / biotin---[acetyl-CoA-carboxylase] ligase